MQGSGGYAKRRMVGFPQLRYTWEVSRSDLCRRSTIIDSRLGWTCCRGKFINVGFGTDDEVATWDKMPLPDTNALRRKVDELEASGYRTNFTFDSSEGLGKQCS